MHIFKGIQITGQIQKKKDDTSGNSIELCLSRRVPTSNYS